MIKRSYVDKPKINPIANDPLGDGKINFITKNEFASGEVKPKCTMEKKQLTSSNGIGWKTLAVLIFFTWCCFDEVRFMFL